MRVAGGLGSRGRRSLGDHPARFVVVAFLGAITVGSLLLLLPWSTVDGRDTSVLTALFTSTSAVCVTGLAVVDTGTHWSGFGQFVLLLLAQLGGLGFMTIASLIAMLVSRRLGLRMSLAATAERRTLALGDVRRVLRGVAVVTVGTEVLVAGALTLRFRFGHGYAWLDAVWHGAFHSVMAFNNAGFGLHPDSFNRYATDPVVTGALMVAIVIGGLGFPVLVDLHARRRDRRRLSLHSRITLWGTAVLLAAGFVVVVTFEWRNPATLGAYDTLDKLWVGLFGSVTPRTAGFHTITPAAMTDEGLLSTMALMFIGAGSAGTSGGIKVGTFALLGMIVIAELRGERDTVVGDRRIPQEVQRQAVTVGLLGVALVALTTAVLLAGTEAPLRDTAFEAVSAFGTVGLSTGITPTLPGVAQVILMAVMLIGRVGPVTLGTALVLRFRTRRFRHPEEAPLIG